VGLAGEEIPRGARLIAVAEAWDTMLRSRPYPRRLAPAQAARELLLGSGTQFCPESVALALEVVGAGARTGDSSPRLAG
jgi:HD-GYP domain-containing protein (c-di-GMP phosphodiesterase class II)